ncbi:UDP-N-acetylmuramoyl-tripeptide--D-alanyl-D-alanine ligase [Persicirhabdus sediminis]|uniref:UDP-N-acetylmuramoyl-tripeptide--D-alanyl-D-alanine ligase n=1 Tax=Persicirhabdus sediminis TaxID=454144 RepID=A0A8J7MBZ8_9BACT|nr:UDP-N-acetylmuramoyl-tripeptide--D-alanyl-D-alanine ligase [Persicirhabdus sediminis]MBK1789793.1 UDP-N-acetylmuramoyl-tripeptide--D-alanyl-D-alanine ligase [Persicirhabdus sediminis]
MKPITVTQIIQATGGQLAAACPSSMAGRAVSAVSTDTRTLKQGDLFVALKGENYDANQFLANAQGAGASVILAESVSGVDLDKTAVVVVADGLLALQRLALWYRSQLNIKVVGITGSNGKTSTKDFTAAVVGEKFKVNATRGNLNNHIGLPLSILSTEEDDEVCIWEMGMNHPGEIAPLCQIAKPDIGVITNIGTAHIEFLKSREGIAEEKGALAKALPDEGTLIVAAVCDFAHYFAERTHADVIFAGNGRGLVRAEQLHLTESGSTFKLVIGEEDTAMVDLPVAGRHMVNNALLAASVGHVLGMKAAEIARGLNGSTLTSGRLRRYDSAGITVFDDTYNANPDSVAAALETLNEMPRKNGGRKIAVLGMMGELGIHADKAHLEVGRLASEFGFQVVSVGENAENIYRGATEDGGDAEQFNDITAAADWLKSFCKSGDLVLFKGSRSAGMERVMNKALPQG